MLGNREEVLCTARSIDSFICSLADPLLELHGDEEPRYVTTSSHQFHQETVLKCHKDDTSPYIPLTVLPILRLYNAPTQCSFLALYHGHSTSKIQSPKQHCALSSTMECLVVIEDVFYLEQGGCGLTHLQGLLNLKAHFAAVKISPFSSFEGIILHAPYTQLSCEQTHMTVYADLAHHPLSVTEVETHRIPTSVAKIVSNETSISSESPLRGPSTTTLLPGPIYSHLSHSNGAPLHLHQCTKLHTLLHFQTMTTVFPAACGAQQLHADTYSSLFGVEERSRSRVLTLVDASLEKDRTLPLLASAATLGSDFCSSITQGVQVKKQKQMKCTATSRTHKSPQNKHSSRYSTSESSRFIDPDTVDIQCIKDKPPLVRTSISRKQFVFEPEQLRTRGLQYLSQLADLEYGVLILDFWDTEIRALLKEVFSKCFNIFVIHPMVNTPTTTCLFESAKECINQPDTLLLELPKKKKEQLHRGPLFAISSADICINRDVPSAISSPKASQSEITKGVASDRLHRIRCKNRSLSWNLSEHPVNQFRPDIKDNISHKLCQQPLSIFDFVKSRFLVDLSSANIIHGKKSPKVAREYFNNYRSGVRSLSNFRTFQNVSPRLPAKDKQFPGGDIPGLSECKQNSQMFKTQRKEKMIGESVQRLQHRRRNFTKDGVRDPKWKVQHAVIQNQYGLTRETRRPLP